MNVRQFKVFNEYMLAFLKHEMGSIKSNQLLMQIGRLEVMYPDVADKFLMI